MILGIVARDGGNDCIPRESGDDPKLCIEDFIQNGYSPRERG